MPEPMWRPTDNDGKSELVIRCSIAPNMNNRLIFDEGQRGVSDRIWVASDAIRPWGTSSDGIRLP